MKILFTSILISLFFIPLGHAQTVNDQDITNRVNQALQNNEEMAGADLLAISVNGYVMLAGQALSDEQKQQASVTATFALPPNTIRHLINELEVVDAIDTSFNNADAALLERVVEALGKMTEHTSLVIHNGTVHLLGTVTRRQGAAVASTISKIDGLKTIRISYDFTD